MKLRKVMGLVAALCLIGVGAFAQGSAYRGADVSAPVIVKYVGAATETVTITPAAGTVTVAGNSLVPSQAITLGVSGVLSELVTALNAITNTSGQLVIKADYWEGLPTDTTTNCLLATAYVLKNANVWEKPILWDTSTHLAYEVMPDTPTASGAPFGGYRINGVYGSPVGTGNVTASIYVDGSLAYQQTLLSPKYILPATWIDPGTNSYTNSYTADALIDLGSEVNIPGGVVVPASKRAFVRAARATTATTGGVGVSITRP